MTIYFIGNKDYDIVKIGYSKDDETIKKRITQIQTYCPFNVEVIRQIEGGIQQERELHKKYFHAKTNEIKKRNEWFKLSAINQIDLIDNDGDWDKRKILLQKIVRVNNCIWEKLSQEAPEAKIIWNFYKRNIYYFTNLDSNYILDFIKNVDVDYFKKEFLSVINICVFKPSLHTVDLFKTNKIDEGMFFDYVLGRYKQNKERFSDFEDKIINFYNKRQKDLAA